MVQEEEQMMSRGKKLLILLAVLAVCVAFYFAARHFFGEEDTNSIIEITNIESADIESVRWIYDGTELEIKPLDEKTWYCANDGEFPLDQDIAIEMLNAVSSVRAVKKVAENPDELSKYGINEPSVRIYVTVGGNTTEYDIGDYNEASGYYYMMYTGDAALYYVGSSLYDMFAKALLDLAEYEYLPEIEIADVESIRIENENTVRDIIYYPEAKEIESREYHYVDSGDLPADGETMEKLLSDFIDISWSSCVSYHVGESELSSFGLDTPTAKFSIQYKYTVAEDESGSTKLDGNDTLLIGNAAEDGSRYAMIQGGRCVYTIEKSTAEQYLIFAN